MASSGARSVFVRSTKTPSNLASCFGFGIIDGEAIFTGRCEEAAITGIADERLIALLELPFERSQDRGTIGGILFRLVVIAADDVATPGKRHRLGLVVDTLTALGDGQRHEWRGIVEHEVAYQFVGALAHTENVEQPARFQF